MIKFKKFISDIPKTTVIEYLSKFEKDDDIKTILRFIYDPKILTGLSYNFLFEKLYSRNTFPKQNTDLYSAIRFFIVNGQLTSKTKKLEVIKSIYIGDPVFGDTYDEDIDLLCKVFSKSLSLGFNVKTLNKAFGKHFIKEFKVLLLNKYTGPESCYFKDNNIVIQEKIDGVRCIFKNGYLYTRAGNILEGMVSIKKDLENVSSEIVLDGELYFNSFKDTISAIAGDQSVLTYHIFDCLPLEEFDDIVPFGFPYWDRYEYLKGVIPTNTDNVRVIDNLYVGEFNESIIDHSFQEELEKGHEGIIIRNAEGLYKLGRSKDVLKLKESDTLDLEIIGFEEGEPYGKFKDSLGAIVLKLVTEDGKESTVRVSSGLTEEDRRIIWENKKDYLGQIAEIEYRKYSEDINGKPSVLLPVLKCIRIDK